MMMKMSGQQTARQTISQSQPFLAPYLDDELEEKRSCIFYRLIVPSILQEKKLRIPDKFVQKFRDDLSSIAKFTTPNGRIWIIELLNENKTLWFNFGWHKFLEDCSICAGYFLIFKYQGNSDFNVYVFDLATSEIEYPCNTPSGLEEPQGSKQCPISSEKSKEKYNSLRILSPLCSPCPVLFSPTIKVTDEGAHYEWNKDYTSGVKLEFGHLSEEVHGHILSFQSPQDNGTQLRSEVTDSLNEVGLYFNSGTKRKIAGPGQITDSLGAEFSSVRVSIKTYTRRWRAVTTEEKKRAFHAAEMFKSDNPFFRVIMRPSYVYRTLLLHVPATFARKYLNGFRGFISVINSNGKQWHVQCIFKNGGTKFSKGWPEFVWENNLDESDVCVFELIKTNDITLKVTIFRVLEDAPPMCQLSI